MLSQEDLFAKALIVKANGVYHPWPTVMEQFSCFIIRPIKWSV